MGLFFALVLLCTHIFNISTSDFNTKLTAMEHVLHVLSHHSQIITQTSSKSCQMCANDPPDHKEKLQAPCCSNFQKRNDQLAWDVTISAATQLHCLAMTLFPIHKTCKKWKLTLSSSMAMYSVMRDIHDARRIPMERAWVALYLYVTCKYSNQLI